MPRAAGAPQVIDKVAATLILQGALDRDGDPCAAH